MNNTTEVSTRPVWWAYSLFIGLYRLGVSIASHFSDKVRKMWKGQHEAFDLLTQRIHEGECYAWFHAASLGEFEQGRPLMEELRRRRPELKIVLTFFSPSGYEVRKNYEGADIVCYLPLDTRTNARRFVEMLKPEMAFFIKYEFWWNYLNELHQRQIPVYSVSSIFRDNQLFFRWYGRRYADVLRCFTHFFVQNEKSQLLLAQIGLSNVTVTGDTRFDRVLQIKQQAEQAFGESNPKADEGLPPVFVAGSSWPPDEEIFIDYFNRHTAWKLIIAPHVIGEDHLQQIEKRLQGRRVVRYTQLPQEPDRLTKALLHADIVIIDCFGLLSGLYSMATVTYVGGGFGVGIHNVLEAAVWGKPVVFGPNNQKFQEAQELKQAGGGFEIGGGGDFELLMERFADDEHSLAEAGNKAGNYVASRAGATETILREVRSEK